MSSVNAILGRIETIETRFNPRLPTPDAPLDAPPPTDFDPFGEHYQQAVQASEASRAAAVATQFPSANVAAAGFSAAGASYVPAPSTGSGGAATPAQVTAAISGTATSPGARQVGGYGSMPIPPELTAFGNGKIPATALLPIGQGSHRLYAPAAASWRNMVAEARASGIDLRLTDSYRSHDNQVDLARRKGLYKDGGLAAVPGTSNHGWGLAVDADVTNAATRDWLKTNGPRFGWVEAVPREPWHWEFRPNQV
jgi:hypothetical protein